MSSQYLKKGDDLSDRLMVSLLSSTLTLVCFFVFLTTFLSDQHTNIILSLFQLLQRIQTTSTQQQLINWNQNIFIIYTIQE